MNTNAFLDIKRESSFDRSDRKKETPRNGSEPIAAQTFTFRELAAATKNFRADCLLGEGGFGRVYKGRLESINQVSSCHFTSSHTSMPLQVDFLGYRIHEYKCTVHEFVMLIHFCTS